MPAWDGNLRNIKPGDEVGGTRIVWTSSFYDKPGRKVYFFIGVDKKGKYAIHEANPQSLLKGVKGRHEKLSKTIALCFNQMKKRCKLKHKKFSYE